MLGYSGMEKYHVTINFVSNNAVSRKLRKHGNMAMLDLNRFIVWNKLIADSTLVMDGKSIEVKTYMKMLNVDD